MQAKAVRKHVEHIITLAKDGSLHKRRQAMAWVYDKDLVNAVFEDAPERYAEREGGYTRIIRYAPPRAAVGTAACAHPRLAHTHARGVRERVCGRRTREWARCACGTFDPSLRASRLCSFGRSADAERAAVPPLAAPRPRPCRTMPRRGDNSEMCFIELV